MPGRWVHGLVMLSALLSGWVWLRADHRVAGPGGGPLIPGEYYAVPVVDEAAVLVPPDVAQVPCDLIVSSLGESSRTYAVTLSTLPGEATLRSRVERVEPIRWLPTGGRQVDAAGVNESGAHVTPGRGSSDRSAPVATDRRFFLHVGSAPLEDPLAYLPVEATLICEGRCVRVYRDRSLSEGELEPDLAERIVRTLDERIIPRSAEIIGTHRDVDGDAKLAVLLTGWLGKLRGGATSVNGFVRSDDFNSQGIAPYSNRADVIYLNSSVTSGAGLTALLAHEYTHAVCCSLRCAVEPARAPWPDEADWLSEGIAHVAERMHAAGWANLDRRIEAYLAGPSASPLVVSDYYRADRWRDAGCRGATFLFLDWCADHAGPGLLRALAADPRVGSGKLESITGIPLPALYRGWTIDVHKGQVGPLDLHRPVGECRLDGPRITRWNAADGPCQLEIYGTASAFVRIESAEGMPAVSITAEPGTRLQVTLAPGPGESGSRWGVIPSGKPSSADY